METEEVRVYRHPNPEIRSYLMGEDITRPRVEAFQRPLAEDAKELSGRLGTIGAQVVRDVMEIQGVLDIRIKPKELRVRKAPDAEWEAIEGQILRILASAARRKKLRVLKG
jgi:hypothetical protein